MTVGRVQLVILVILVALAAAAPASAQVPPDPVIAEGVTIAGVAVGGMTRAEATDAVRAFFQRPVRMALGGQRLSARPYWLGARASIGAPCVPRSRRPLTVRCRCA